MKDRTTKKNTKDTRRTAWFGGGRHFRQICGLLLTVAMLLSLCPISLAADTGDVYDKSKPPRIFGPIHENDACILGTAPVPNLEIKVTLNTTNNQTVATTNSKFLFDEDVVYWKTGMPSGAKVDDTIYATIATSDNSVGFAEQKVGTTGNILKFFVTTHFETEMKDGTSVSTVVYDDEYTVLNQAQADKFADIVKDKDGTDAFLPELVINGILDESYTWYEDKDDELIVEKYFEAVSAKYYPMECGKIGFLCIYMEEGNPPPITPPRPPQGGTPPSGSGGGGGPGPGPGPGSGGGGNVGQTDTSGAGGADGGAGAGDGDGNLTGGSSRPVTLPAAMLPRFAQGFLDDFIPLAAFTPEHIAYLYGYEEGDVKPDATIPRSQAASLIFRILSATDKNEPLENLFEFQDWEWYAQAVAYLTHNDIIMGYEDGTFRPDGHVTRAEFVAMICRFDMSEGLLVTEFSDVAGHWAEEYIAIGASNGWISGYGDGTFRPDGNITRAEVVSLINRLLYRGIELVDIPGWAPVFTDLNSSHWAYPDIMEAATSHEFERKTNGYEVWTASYSVL